MFLCEYCGLSFEKKSLLKNHECKKECRTQKVDKVEELVSEVVFTKNQLEQKVKKMEIIIEDLLEKINTFKLEKKIDNFRMKVLSHLFKTMTNTDIETFYSEEKDGIHIYDVDSEIVSVMIHNISKEKDDDQTDIKKLYISTKKSPKLVYKTVKNRVKLVEENSEKKREKIKKTEEKFKKIKDEKLDHTKEEITLKINQFFSDIRKNRVYKKYLQELRKIREYLLGHLNINEYITLVNKHIKELETIFTQKKYEKKKIINNISEALSPLDMHLAFYANYYSRQLEVEEIQRCKDCFELNRERQFPKKYEPFSYTSIFSRFEVYVISFYTVKEILKNVLVNPYQFSNIVFFDADDEKIPKDPFRFYTLEKIKKNANKDERCWKMEIRLEDFSRTICEHMKKYCITLFRKIYSDVFDDNIYRENYTENIPIFSQECAQLFENIKQLSKIKECCIMIQKIIVKFCVIQPTELDKFNLIGDDKVHKRQFQKDEDTEENTVDTIQLLFNNISRDQAKKLIDENMGK